MWRITTPPTDLNEVRDALEEAEVSVEFADLTMLPTSTVEMTDVGDLKKLMHLIDVLDDLDDVQDVQDNSEAAHDLMESARTS